MVGGGGCRWGDGRVLARAWLMLPASAKVVSVDTAKGNILFRFSLLEEDGKPLMVLPFWITL